MPRHQHRQHQGMVCLADVNLEEGEEGCKSEEDTRAVLYIKDKSASKETRGGRLHHCKFILNQGNTYSPLLSRWCRILGLEGPLVSEVRHSV